MATGQAGEAGFDKINQRLDELNNKFDRLVRESEQANKAIASMGDTFEKLGVQMGNVASVTDVFNQMRANAVTNMKGISNSAKDVFNEIVEAAQTLPQAFSKDFKFIDIETLRGQRDEILKTHEDMLAYHRQRRELLSEWAMKVKEENKTLSEDSEIYKENLDYLKDINKEDYSRKKSIKQEKDFIHDINIEWAENIESAEQYNQKIIASAANYEATIKRIKELKDELNTIVAIGRADEEVKTDNGDIKTRAELIQEEVSELEKRSAIEKIYYDLVQQTAAKEKVQAEIVADMVNEELRLKNLKQQQLVNEIKANYAEEQKKKKLEEQTKEAERQLEVRKEIASIKQTDVKSMGVDDIRKLYSNAETLKKKLLELEAAGQSNSRQYKESKEKLNAYTAKLKEAGIAMDGFKKASSNTNRILSSLASQFGLVFSIGGIVSFLNNIIKITGEFELQEKALGAIIQSQEKANDMFNKLTLMATKSPYNIQQLVSYNRQLAAYRVETEKLLPTMKMLGDVAAGVGVDMQRLILAYGQVKAANYLRGQELRQFSEAGINILGELADKFTEVEGRAVSTGEVFERVSKRMVTFDDVNEVFERLTQKGGIFYEMQQKQAETLRGQIKNLADAFKIEANKMGSSISDTVKTAVGLLKILMKSLSTLLNIGKGVLSLWVAYKIALTVANTKAKIMAYTTKGLTTANALYAMSIRKVERALLSLNLQFEKATNGAKGFSAFMKGGGWAGAIMLAVTAAIELAMYVHKINKELAEIDKRGLELRSDLGSSDYFGFRQEGDFKGMKWIDVYEKKAVTLEEKFALVDQMLEQLQKRGIDIAYDIDKNGDNAVEKIDEFAHGLEDVALRLSVIKTTFEQAKVEADKFWNRFSYTQYSEFDPGSWSLDPTFESAIEDFTKSYSAVESKFANQNTANVQSIKEYYDSAKDVTTEEQKTYNLLLEIENINNKNVVLKRKEIELEERLVKLYEQRTGKKIDKYEGYGDSNIEEYSQRFEALYEKFSKQMEENRGLLEEDVELGSIEHVKKIKQAIQATFPEISKEIQEQLLLNVLQRKYPNIELNYDLVFDQIKYPEPSEYTQHFQKKFDELQSEYIEGMSEDLKKMFDTDGMLNYANAFHKETKTVVKEIEGVKTAVQEVVKVEDDWVKLKGKDWLNILPEETGDDIRKRLSTTIKDVQTFKKDILQETTDIYEVVRAFNAFGIAEIIKVPAKATEEQIKQIRDEISSYSNLYEDFLKKAQKEVGGREEERNRAAKSYTSEFNTMINFIKKLNTETEKLGKTFDTYLSTDKYKSALEQVRKAFTSEFKSMPKEFQQMFSGLMENVDFSDRNVILQQLEQLKTLAKSGKYKKDAEEIIRNIEAVMSPMEADMKIEVKTADDKELQRQVEDMFSDYEITVELQKLGIDADTAKSFFGLDYTDLNTLQKKIFNMQKQFTGADAVEKYRSYIDKLFKITDKANLDAVKKYSKYLQYEMGERVRIEMDYQRQMGEVYGSSAFTGEQKTDIIGNLEKEMKKKLQKMDWDEFKATDYYIEMFQNLEFASTSAINTMITKLADLRDSMSELDATQVKEIAKQMEALEDEMIRRNPFQSLISSMKEWNAAKKAARDDEEYKSILPTDYEIESTSKMLYDVIDEIDKKLNVSYRDGEKGLIALRKEAEETWQAAKTKENAEDILKSIEAISRAKGLGVDIDISGVEGIESTMESLKVKIESAREEYNKLLNPTTSDIDIATKYKEEESSAQSLYNVLGQLLAAYKTLGDESNTQAFEAKANFDYLNYIVEQYTKTQKKAKNEVANQKKAVKAIKELASVFQQVNEKSKEVFDSIMDNLDYLGSVTDENTEAWKEFGDAIFDTVTSALTMIPMLVTGFTSAGEAINASMGIIGLIAEAIQLTITLVKALAKIHDNDLEDQITSYTKKIDDLKKAYDRYQEAFDAAWDYNKMRRFYDLAQATAERQIQNYQSMIDLEKEKKKADEEKIKEWRDAIEELQEEILDNREKIMNELGGFGSEEDMGSAAEQFASAWYDAFLETGSGLQALEDTFQSFLENIVKKQLLLQGSQQILGPLFTSINEMLSDGIADAEEVAAIIDRWNNETIGQLNAYYESLGQMFQAAGVGGGLEGLQQGIQGVTEDTAEIIAAYMNTIRFDVAQQNTKLDTIVQTLQLDTATNPLIHNLRIIAQQTTDIRVLLDSVVRVGHPLGESGIKVFMD